MFPRVARLPPRLVEVMKNLPLWSNAGIGIEYAGAVAGFGLVGWWIDSAWDTSPWGVLVAVALGLIGATYNLVRQSLAAFKTTESEKKTPERDD